MAGGLKALLLFYSIDLTLASCQSPLVNDVFNVCVALTDLKFLVGLSEVVIDSAAS